MRPTGLVVFDLDGTLTATYDVDERCYLAALRHFGFEEVDRDWARYPHVTDSGILAELWRTRRGRPPSPAEATAFGARLGELLAIELAATPCSAVPGAAAALTAIAGGGAWAAAIATGCLAVSARHKLASSGLTVFDLPLATGDDAPSRAGIVRRAVDRARRRHRVDRFERLLLVGDASWDLATADELGLPLVAVGARSGELLARGAAHALPDLRGFGDLLDSLA